MDSNSRDELLAMLRTAMPDELFYVHCEPDSSRARVRVNDEKWPNVDYSKEFDLLDRGAVASQILAFYAELVRDLLWRQCYE
jgi:hypothetical protein